jgi:hypothetical protein
MSFLIGCHFGWPFSVPWRQRHKFHKTIKTGLRTKRRYRIVSWYRLEALDKNSCLTLQLGQSAQPAVQAVEVKQQARLVRLSIPPILPLGRLCPFFTVVYRG